MAYVRDLWYKQNTRKNALSKKVKTTRWGKGKRWQAVWDENGKSLTKTFRTEDAAEEYCARVDVAQAEGTWITKDKRDITFADLWEPWIAAKEQKGLAKKTVAGYRSAWAHIDSQWGVTPVAEADIEVILAWIPTLVSRRVGQDSSDAQPIGSGTQRKIGLVFKGLFDLAVTRKILHSNPMKKGDLVTQAKGSRRALRVTEADALIDAAPTWEAKLLARTLLMTGLRPGEAKGLRVKDLDYYRSRLHVRGAVDALGNYGPTKTRTVREVPIGGELLLDLDDQAADRDEDDWLIPDEYGHVWTDARWRRVWARMCETAGLEDVDTYTLRHTAVSLAIASGADVYAVQRMCGHASAATTLDIYGHLWDAGLDAVPGAMDEHMKAEREREKLRAQRRAERATRGRGRLRAVGED